jgi:hypothetical protein
MRGYVGVVDSTWYRFLAARPEITEVNFWAPSGAREFRALRPGEFFFFKTHYPHNRVVGGGVFSGAARMRVSEVWTLFGQANGVESLEEMRAHIGHYLKASLTPADDPEISCILITNVIFYPLNATFRPPPAFAHNIVQGKSYDLSEANVSEYFEHLINTHTIVSTLLKLNDVGTIVEALAGSDKGLPAAEGALIGQRRELVANLSKMAENPDTTETELQQAIGDAYWLFGGRYVGIADWRSIGPLDQHDIPLLCADGTLHIVELKGSKIPNLVRRHRNHWIVGSAVHEAASQAMNYLRTLDENGAGLETTYRNEFGVDYDMRRAFATVVIGHPVHVIGANARVIDQTLRSYNAHLSRVEVITYTTLLDTAERALVFEDTSRAKRKRDGLSSRDKFQTEISEPSLEEIELDN